MTGGAVSPTGTRTPGPIGEGTPGSRTLDATSVRGSTPVAPTGAATRSRLGIRCRNRLRRGAGAGTGVGGGGGVRRPRLASISASATGGSQSRESSSPPSPLAYRCGASSAWICAGVGRRSGAGRMQALTSGASSSGSPDRSGARGAA